MTGWFADAFRAIWALLCWNSRKTLFRLRGAHGTPPCQNPSDSGRPLETRCDACHAWRDKARFRHVCPLLQRSPEGGWRCSAPAREVRPFWGRSFGFFLGAALALYLVATTGLFVAMRQIGYPVTYVSFAWPPAWDDIRGARATYFFERAEQAYGENRLQEALMSLSLAYHYAPQNHGAGLMLARLWQTHRPDLSNQMYARLLADHPEQRPAIAEAWLRALVPRADDEAIEELAAAALEFDPDHTAAWLQALLFAHRRTGNIVLLDRLLTPEHALPDGVRYVLELEAALRSDGPAAGRLLLAEPPPRELPHFVALYHVNRLLQLGHPREALDLAARESGRLADRDRIAVELAAYRALGYERLLASALDRALGFGPSLATIETISLHLIAHPNADLSRRFWRWLEGQRLPEGPEAHAVALTLFTLAACEGNREQLARQAGQLRQLTGASYAALDLAAAHFSGERTLRIPDLLPLLQPLALEVNYALLEHLAPRAPSQDS